jgi:hypothetical protein
VLDAPPKESEGFSWIYVAFGVLVIYSTIPVARALRELVRENIGLKYFLYITVALVLLAGFLAFRNLNKRDLPLNAKLCLAGIFTAFLFYIYKLRDIPEEALHIAEYGILGLLVFRALTHRIHDFSIFIVAVLVVGIVGIVDEYIQWLTPSRYFDLRDIRTNFVAGALAQLAIATGLRPSIISGMPSALSWSRVCYFSVVALALMTIGFMNTPERIAWYATKVPVLSYLMNSKSMMVEYGYIYDDPDLGVFRSRFTAEQLRQFDRDRGTEVAEILDRYIRGEGYNNFQSIYSVTRDAYAHEAGVHLFSREFHIDRARENNDNKSKHYSIAYHENRFLERYFSSALKDSTHYWSQETEREVSQNAARNERYESSVSKGVITRMSQMQVVLLFVVMIILLTLLGFRLRGDKSADQISITTK